MASKNPLYSRYRTALTSISARTGTSLPALLTSFAILHEATAIIPLVGVFYAARTLGVGHQFVSYVRQSSNNLAPGGSSWVRETTERWMHEGEDWTKSVGKRYGIWGFEKKDKSSSTGSGIAGDVANALVAYCATKALLPVRIGVSLYFSPALARGVVNPISRSIARIIRRSSR